MLTTLHLGNFKAFDDTQSVPVRPLTLVYGPNSAGKSSLIHGLILARQAAETGDLDVHRASVGGDSVDLGGFRQYVHRRDTSRHVEWAMELDTSHFTGRLAGLLAAARAVTARVEIGLAQAERKRKRQGTDPRTGQTIDIEEPTGEMISVGDPAIRSFRLEADSALLLQMSCRPDGRFQLDSLDHQHPVFRGVIRAIVESSTTTDSLQPSDYEGLDEAVDAIVPDIIAECKGLLPGELVKGEATGTESDGQLSLFPISRGRRKEDLAAAVRFFLPRTLDELLKGVSKAVSAELDRVQYLGPLRSYPPRHLAFAQHHDPNWFAGGGYAWDVVRRDERVRQTVNRWLSSSDRLQTPYELTPVPLFDQAEIERLFSAYVEMFNRDYSGLGVGEELPEDHPNREHGFTHALSMDLDSELGWFQDLVTQQGNPEVKELVLRDMRTETSVSHRDVGIGISQVLPVLVSAYGAENRIVAIEQPEIHLHPKLQAELGDVFLESALGERRNTFLLETHSEHVLLRIMKRMRQTAEGSLPGGCPAVQPEDVMVLYVEPDGPRSIVREMPLNERGELAKAWPGGFFEESFDEMF